MDNISNFPARSIEGVADRLRDSGVDAFSVLAQMLAAAGSQPEWDSETIEHVLDQAIDASNSAGLPWCGSTADDGAGLEFWADVAGIELDDDYDDSEQPHWLPLND